MKNCINCGVELEDGAKFCGECGTKQPEPTKYCSNCGVELTPNAKFCMECGSPVGDNTQSPNPTITKSTEPDTILSQPKSNSDGNISVTKIDDNTISIVLKGIPFNLKLVKGKNYGTDKEINDFYIGETPVTQALYMTVTGNNPSEDNEDLNYPVTNITPALANSFLVKLQKETGVKFELLTKAQWNFAYKGGNKSKGFDYSGSNDINEVGWIDNFLHPVGELYPNELGIYDMEGNVSELLKGNDLTSLPSDSPKEEITDNFKGFRIVFNYNTDGKIEGNSILQKVLASQVPKLKVDWEMGKKKADEDKRKNETYEEELKSIKNKSVRERILSYKTRKGIIIYDNWKEVEDNLGFLIPDLQTTANSENFKKGKLSLDYKKMKWKTFGELAFDEDEYEIAEDFEDYEEEVEYTIIDGHTLVLKCIIEKNGELPEFADEEWISENEDNNYWKINDDIKQNLSEITAVVILKGVSYINTDFNLFKNLRYLFIADTVHNIGEKFNKCKNLETVFISPSTRVSDSSFEGCPKMISSDEISNRILKKVKEYKKQNGIIKYSDYEEIKEIFPYLDKVAYKKFQEEEEKIKNIVDKQLSSSNLVWKTFGELGRDKDDYETTRFNYNSEVKYTIINEKILVLKGNGCTPNFLTSNEELDCIMHTNRNYWQLNEEIRENSNTITSLVVLEGIEEIGRLCCDSLRSISTIILPNSLKRISERAFNELYDLQYINLPEKLQRIAEGAFEGCSTITSILIPPSVENIEEYAFGDCRKLKYLFVSKRTDVDDDVLNEPERLISL